MSFAEKQYKFPHVDTFPHQEVAWKRRWILRYAKKGGVGAELGVFRGHFSAVIANVLTPKRLYLVDPWSKLGERYNWGTGPYTNANQLTTAEAMADARHRLREFGDAITFVEDFEENFLHRLDEKLDFIYLDSSHYYDAVIGALPRAAAVLKDDGVIFGDDWYSNPEHFSGVCRAVNEFVKKTDFEIVAAGYDAQFCIRRIPIYSHLKATTQLDQKF